MQSLLLSVWSIPLLWLIVAFVLHFKVNLYFFPQMFLFIYASTFQGQIEQIEESVSIKNPMLSK